MSPPEPLATSTALGRGLRGRCPRCGKGSLFTGFLTVVDRCASCGLRFGGHDAGDGPAFAAIFILGAVVVGLALLLERAAAPPLWLHAVLWGPLVIGGAVLLLRPLKGMAVALQHRFRSVEGEEDESSRHF